MIIHWQYSNVPIVLVRIFMIYTDICTMKIKTMNAFGRTILLFGTTILFLIFQGNLLAQNNTFDVEVPWQESIVLKSENKTITLPSIKDQGYSGNRPYFQWSNKVSGGSDYDITVSDVRFASVISSDITYFTDQKIEVPGSFIYEAKISNSREIAYASVAFEPFVKQNGTIKRIAGFKVVLTPKAKPFKAKSFVANSVLSDYDSRWYKISVKEDGIYKIDKAFLTSIGVDVSNLDPRHINIYGNGNGKLPELNSVFRPDDLVKNDIEVIGESDGVFDDNDYLLFHGWGPNRWYKSGVNYLREMNPYSVVSCYYIRISATDPPARIQTMPAVAMSNVNVNTYNYADIYEREMRSLVGGGQVWYGESFDVELSRTFSFSIPNIDATVPANFKISMASNAKSTGNSVNIAVNGSTVSSFPLSVSGEDYVRVDTDFLLNNPSSILQTTMTVNRVNPAVLTYLDKIEINARRNLVMNGNLFYFRDFNSVGAGNVANFSVEGFNSGTFVWDITDRRKPVKIAGDLAGTNFSFKLPTDTLREFLASKNSGFLTPVFDKVVVPQNLHAMDAADLLIVTPVQFLTHAERLANLHRGEGMTVNVATTEQIYNEFSSGSLDPTAIRWFAKMFYDRAAGNVNLMPKNLLLFGGGTYDPKGIISNANYVPTYQVVSSEKLTDALVVDDYFGMLDDNESLANSDNLDLGIGRMLIVSDQVAKEQVDKVEIYMKNATLSPAESTFGDWRLKYVQIADDEDYFLVQDCEPQSAYVGLNYPEMNVDKLYSDAFTKVTGAGGERFPGLVEAINDRVERGALVINYVGHGGVAGAGDERFISIPQIQSWTNLTKLHLFVSATCEFTRFDDPSVVSAGEWNFLNTKGGAIALMTTTRSVYYQVNTQTGKRFYESVFQRDGDLQPLTFGEIVRRTKNATNEGINKRSFMLIGDPALKIALPKLKIVTDSINHFNPALVQDTVRALTRMNVKGHIEDENGNILTNYNGVISPTIYDKPKDMKTLGQNTTKTTVLDFQTQQNAIYKGKATVSNGRFDFSFIVPKDIAYNYGPGKISYYGNNTEIDAFGSDKRFIVGGVNPNGLVDNTPPTVEMYLNEVGFVNGGLTDEKPKFYAKIFDENGINAVGNGIGHDMMIILDNNSAKPIILNNFYAADLDSYQSGKVEYNFTKLSVGKHTLTFKVWDVNNNSTEATLDFVVAEKKDITLDHVLNYPNPFTTRTEFFFEHNQVLEQLEAQIQIFTVSGKLVKTINQLVNTRGFRSEGILWDGRDDFGDQIAKGVYVYQLTVRTQDGDVAKKTEKLVLLK